MKYVQYLVLAVIIALAIAAPLALLVTPDYARTMALLTFPLGLWTGRLIIAKRRGIITRRIARLDGGAPREAHIFSFNPDVYVRKPGFDHFKGYFFKEALTCLIVWAVVLGPTLMKVLDEGGIAVR